MFCHRRGYRNLVKQNESFNLYKQFFGYRFCEMPTKFLLHYLQKDILFVFLTCKCIIDTNCVSGAIRLEDCNDGIENDLISCHFSKEGLEECELRAFALINRRRLKNELKRRNYYAVPPFPKQN